MSEVYVPQGAKQFNEKAIRQVIDSQGCIWMAPKIDGIRCTLTWQGGALTALSRSNKPIASLSKWLEVTEGYLKENRVVDFRFDGELTVAGLSFQKASGMLRRKAPIAPDLVYFTVFQDTLYPNASFDERYHSADNIIWAYNIPFAVVPVIEVDDYDDLVVHYEEYRNQGYEGAVIYHPYGVHCNGKAGHWYKMKPEESLDGIVRGWYVGEKALEGLMGGLSVELENGLIVHVGTGFTLEQRKDPQQFMRRYVEISYMELTDDGNLRHPSFKCFRDLDEHKGVKL